MSIENIMYVEKGTGLYCFSVKHLSNCTIFVQYVFFVQFMHQIVQSVNTIVKFNGLYKNCTKLSLIAQFDA